MKEPGAKPISAELLHLLGDRPGPSGEPPDWRCQRCGRQPSRVEWGEGRGAWELLFVRGPASVSREASAQLCPDCEWLVRDGKRKEKRRAAVQASMQAYLAALPRAHRALSPDLVKPEQLAILERWIAAADRWSLYLHGETGTGKTFLAYLTGYLWMQHDLRGDALAAATPPIVWFSIDLISCLQMEAGEGSEATVLKLCRYEGLVMIDDLGTGKVTDFALQQLERIVHHREEWRRKTVVTSNLDLSQLGELLNARIARRLAGGEVRKLTEKIRRRAE